MVEVKRSVLIKCRPAEDLDGFFDRYGRCVNHVLEHVAATYDEYEETTPEEKRCAMCAEKKMLAYQHVDKPGETICFRCFRSLWSEYFLMKNYMTDLVALADVKTVPLVGIQKGYYRGAICMAVQIFKSYIRRKAKRDKEIARAKQKCTQLKDDLNSLGYQVKKVQAAIRKGRSLSNRLSELVNKRAALKLELRRWRKASKKKRIRFPVFRNNVIYFGAASMFRFKKEDGGYRLGISDYKQLRRKIWLSVETGEYQKGFIDQCIKENQHRQVYPKLMRRQALRRRHGETSSAYDYFFILPARKKCEAPYSKSEVEAYVEKQENHCCMLP